MMGEAQAVGEKLGVEFKISLEQRIAGAEGVGAHKTSMLQDVEHGRALELQALVGSVVELGAHHRHADADDRRDLCGDGAAGQDLVRSRRAARGADGLMGSQGCKNDLSVSLMFATRLPRGVRRRSSPRAQPSGPTASATVDSARRVFAM